MSSLLSERQKDDLYVASLPNVLLTNFENYSHKSILEYLYSNGFTESFNSLKEETGIEHTPDAKSKYNGLLEKKWTSVIRLQKKVGLRPATRTKADAW